MSAWDLVDSMSWAAFVGMVDPVLAVACTGLVGLGTLAVARELWADLVRPAS